MKVELLYNKLKQLDKDIKEVDNAIAEVRGTSSWEKDIDKDQRHIVKVLYGEYCQLKVIQTGLLTADIGMSNISSDLLDWIKS